jgi:hypothetical protein
MELNLYNSNSLSDVNQNRKQNFFLQKQTEKKDKNGWKKPGLKSFLKQIKKNSMILFGDEASFGLWGSLGYTWSPKGEQPLV